MDETETRPRPAGAAACGCQAAFAFLVIVGLPLLFVFSLGNAPCQDGPCDPNGAQRLGNVALVVAALALVLGLSTWWLVGWWPRRQVARGKGRRCQLERAGALLALLALLAIAALLGLIVF